jgi:ABC-type polysaccharide/polyol phosphate transport system ATPase subunit
MPVIEVNHVTKEYRLGALHNFKHTLQNVGARLRGERMPKPLPFKALDDVDFTVEEGEVVGIIGHNGAGKSTLLKHLAGISTPTKGNVVVRGKVAPLIEVGAGLIGDLTGRENIYLNATILGLSRKEIDRKLDEIIAFAELEEFIDTPIKRYSSGMSVRLGFSIATSVDADILIVDEVLAVGDLAFQRKCFDRMEDLIKRQGKTVLLVSHNIRQVERICQRVILLESGRVIEDDLPTLVAKNYYEKSDEKIRQNAEKAADISRLQATNKGSVQLVSAKIFDTTGISISSISYLADLVVRLTFHTENPITKPVFGIGVHTTDMLYLANQDTQKIYHDEVIPIGQFNVNCTIRKIPFLPGVYSIRFSVAEWETVLFYRESLIHFTIVSDTLNLAYAKEQGFINIETSWVMGTCNKAN